MADSPPRVTKQDIVRGLTRLGVCAGDILLVHSSLSRFGYVEGGADAVIDALLESVRPGGTVMVPTLTGSEKLSAANPPTFDPVNQTLVAVPIIVLYEVGILLARLAYRQRA